jgi:23S rRNA (cytosine1962-C5)-methyltransferase
VAAVRWLEERVGADLLSGGTDCFRIAEGTGLWFERFGPAGLVSSAADRLPEGFVDEALAHPLAGGLGVLYHRVLVRGPGSGNAPVPVWGDPGDGHAEVREEGLAFRVDFSSGCSCGLFLDQRGNRRMLRSPAPRHVLNCFAFTCSFSVAAAAGGARTTNVDIAKHALARGRENFDANNLPTSGHRFLVDDVSGLLPRFARRGERFDAIILDPPTFSRGKGGRVFRAEDSLGSLLGLAATCAAPGARILLSTNASRLTTGSLRATALDVCPRATRIEPGPALPDISHGARSVWIHL